MNKIDALIAEHCKNGVAFERLDVVCNIANNKRKPVESSLRISGKIPYYGANNIQDYVEGFTHDGVYVLIAEDGSANLDNYSIQYATGKFWANNHVHVISGGDALDNRFLFHYLKSMNFRPFLSGGDRAKLTKARMIEIEIPLPPLPVQHEIVTILDAFTQLEAELEAELEARKKQYEYYRNKLLNFDKNITGGVTYKMLSEVANLQRGKRLVKSQLEKTGKYAVYQNSMIPLGYYHESNVKSDTTFVISAGAAGEIGHSNFDFWAADDVYFLTDSESVMSKYLYYCLLVQQNKILGQVRRASIPRLSRAVIEKLIIPVPPLSEQARIVTILDKFDVLVNDISNGLPAEIKARRSQYEYYRNQLLTFPNAEQIMA